jgi:hypothetical protein
MSRKLQQIYSEQVTKRPISLHLHTIREFASKTEVKKAIVAANPDLKLGSDKRGAIRIQPATKVKDKEEFTANFLETLKDINLVVVDKIKPGPDAPSSKFDSYVVKSGGNEFIITLGGGANKGQSFEQEIMKSLVDYFEGEQDTEKPAILDELENALDVEFVGVDKGVSFTRAVKRPLTPKGANDRGYEIADLTLLDDDDNKYYISLKNKDGKTVSNGGASGMFSVKDDKVKFVNRERDGVGGELFKAAGANIKYIERGLTDYVNKEVSSNILRDVKETTDKADLDKLEKFIMSAFDYGYIYVKQKTSKSFEVADLDDEDKLREFIGDIKSVSIKYPYYENDKKSRKHVSIIIETENGVYSFDVRNASGDIIPNQINLVRGKSKEDIKAAKASVKAISKTNKTLADELTNL